jgi:uncharacterized protein YbbC (DUF1343 family)/CubicO group peptidase (beta-lactamase class C family)
MDQPSDSLCARRRFLAGATGLAATALALPDLSARTSRVFDDDRLALATKALDDAVAAKLVPGAVWWLERLGAVRSGHTGSRMIDPEVQPMRQDTIFDVASLTKVVATAPSIFLLIQEGKLSLDTRVGSLIPAFAGNGKDAVTIRHLLTHTSGTRSGIPRTETPWSGYAEGIQRAATEPLINPPDTKFLYSDINFILLGEIVRLVSGSPVSEFAAARIFRPLGMRDTSYLPSRRLVGRIAPTTREAAGLVHGVVHDPTARLMGGVAGHAGLFSTAGDLARFCRMLLKGGRTDAGRRIFTSRTVQLMTGPVRLRDGTVRTNGFDNASRYADPKGECFGPRSFGHTGWTGTALWIDPDVSAFVVLLTNRNHPREGNGVKELRWQFGTLAAEAMGLPKRRTAWQQSPQRPKLPARRGRVSPGIDALAADGFREIAGAKAGLITNHTGRDLKGTPTIDVLAKAGGLSLRALFSPEHGIRGTEDRDGIADGRDASTGLPVFSLYGERRRPSAAQLKDLDTLVFDIQDIGCRFYTYVSTMLECMQAAAGRSMRFVVLDRVNPIGGSRMEGPVSSGKPSFTACHPIPVRHGMTAGELARLFQRELSLDLELKVVPVSGWSRREFFPDTGLPWINPSPNMRSPDAAVLYPGVGLLEFCKLSVGRGTDAPFQFFGAPWMDARKLCDALGAANLPGLRVSPASFTPSASVFKGEACQGVQLTVTNRSELPSVAVGMHLAAAVVAHAPTSFDLTPLNKLLVHEPSLKALQKGAGAAEVMQAWQGDLLKFMNRRQPVLLYPEAGS